MRWFISWWLTALTTGLVALGTILLDWLAAGGHAWAVRVRETLTPPIPGLLEGYGAPAFIVLAQLGFWALARLVLIRIFAYVNSEETSSPRGAGGWRAGSGRRSILLFHNPTGWWLAPFAVALNVLVWSAASFELNFTLGYSPPIPVAVWGLSVLFGLTLTSAMLTPDRPLRLRPVEDSAERLPDPLLQLPEEEPEGTSPALGAA